MPAALNVRIDDQTADRLRTRAQQDGLSVEEGFCPSPWLKPPTRRTPTAPASRESERTTTATIAGRWCFSRISRRTASTAGEILSSSSSSLGLRREDAGGFGLPEARNPSWNRGASGRPR